MLQGGERIGVHFAQQGAATKEAPNLPHFIKIDADCAEHRCVVVQHVIANSPSRHELPVQLDAKYFLLDIERGLHVNGSDEIHNELVLQPIN